MMEKVVGWAINKVVTEEIETSIATAALMGAALDSAAFTAIGVPGGTALAAGAATGAGHHLYKRIRGEKQT
jgi:hypothetical protein